MERDNNYKLKATVFSVSRWQSFSQADFLSHSIVDIWGWMILRSVLYPVRYWLVLPYPCLQPARCQQYISYLWQSGFYKDKHWWFIFSLMYRTWKEDGKRRKKFIKDKEGDLNKWGQWKENISKYYVHFVKWSVRTFPNKTGNREKANKKTIFRPCQMFLRA